jgi:AraC-like DNA-binding protein
VPGSSGSVGVTNARRPSSPGVTATPTRPLGPVSGHGSAVERAHAHGLREAQRDPDIRGYVGRAVVRPRSRQERHVGGDLRIVDSNVEAAANLVGYRSPKNFYAALKAETGLTPSEARNLTEAQVRRLLDVELGMKETATGFEPWSGV